MTAAVYAIVDGRTDAPVYIGKTKNLRRRLDAYRNPHRCHNKALADWLVTNADNWRVDVLSSDPLTLDEVERREIAAKRPQLFNMVHGGQQSWRRFQRRPWTGRPGILCPSTIMARLATVNQPSRVIKDICARRADLHDHLRISLEIECAVSLAGKCPRIDARLFKWIEHSLPSIEAFYAKWGIDSLKDQSKEINHV